MGFDSRVASLQVSSYCLDFEMVVKINQSVVSQTGEPHWIRDRGGILGALGRPLLGFEGNVPYPTVVDKAGALIHGLATAHGFEQGNKRTSFICGMSYLSANGFELRQMSPQESGPPLVQLVERQIDLINYTQWLASNLR